MSVPKDWRHEEGLAFPVGAMTVWVVVRDLDALVEVDVFATEEAAQEHFDRLGGPGDTRIGPREEIVAGAAWAPIGGNE